MSGVAGNRRERRRVQAPVPGFEAVQNDLGAGIRARDMRELREAAENAVIQMRLMRDPESRLFKAADRLERAIRAIPATS